MAPIQFSMKTTGVPLVLLVLFYLSFSVSNHHQNLFLYVCDFLLVSNSKPGRFVFFLVFNFITLIISLRSSKTSEADFEGFFPQTSLLYEPDTTTIDIDDKFQCRNNVDDNEHEGYDGSIEDNDEDINSGDIGSEEEDDDDDDDDENDTDNEMKKRAEEFIAKVKKKWKEELLADRLLCITAA